MLHIMSDLASNALLCACLTFCPLLGTAPSPPRMTPLTAIRRHAKARRKRRRFVELRSPGWHTTNKQKTWVNLNTTRQCGN